MDLRGWVLLWENEPRDGNECNLLAYESPPLIDPILENKEVLTRTQHINSL